MEFREFNTLGGAFHGFDPFAVGALWTGLTSTAFVVVGTLQCSSVVTINEPFGGTPFSATVSVYSVTASNLTGVLEVWEIDRGPGIAHRARLYRPATGGAGWFSNAETVSIA